MKKTLLLSTIATAFSLALSDTCQASDMEMEKCKINDSTGKSLIKEGMADCASEAGNSCAGANKKGDHTAWIYLPKGVCGKIEGCTSVK
ncbi:MAG: DUF2282 domain-containing protein [Alphaproteobacteria bacterium]|nr:DUF2282 domain-containing protein [Alphaproteobacteria bacterium]